MKTKLKATLALFSLFGCSYAITSCSCDSFKAEDNNFVYHLSSGAYEIVSVKKPLTVVNIPEMIKGRRITRIGKKVFQSQNQLTTVNLSTNLEEIGYAAFMNCSGLTKVNFPSDSHLKNIESHAFCNSSNLIVDYLPSSVTSVGAFAFQYVRGISLMYLPKEIKSIGSCAFEGCSNAIFFIENEGIPTGWDKDWNKGARPYLTGVDKDYGTVENRGNFKVLINDNKAHLIGVLNQSELEGDILLPSKVNDVPVTSIISNLFSPSEKNNKAISVIIPSGYDIPDVHSFDGLDCANLYFVNQDVEDNWISEFESIHNGCTVYDMVSDEKLDNDLNFVKSNGNAILTQNISATGEIKPSASIAFDTGDANLIEIAPRAFRNDTDVTGLTLVGLTEFNKIGDYAFYGCTALKTIKLGNTKIIGKRAFSGSVSMSAIEEVATDANLVTTIGEEAFKKTSQKQTDIASLFATGNKITSIGSSAFDNCLLANEHIYFNDNLQKIQQYTFHDADETTTFHVSNTLFESMKSWGYKITQYTDITGVYYKIDSATKPLGQGHIVVEP